MTKSICFFTQYYPNLGGVENYTYNLSKLMLKNGYRVTIVTSNIYRLPEYEMVDGIEIYRVPCINLLNGRYPVLRINKQFHKLNKRLNEQDFDLVIVNTRFYIHSLYGVKFASKRKIKSIVIDHGTAHISIGSPLLDRIGAVWEHILTSMLMLYCKDFYGVSYACTRWLKHFKITAKGVLYNSVDVERIRSILENTQVDFHKAYELPDNAIIITYTGRLVAEKGIINLIKAVTRLRNENYPVYLFIAGDGPLKDEIDSLKSEFILPLGRIDFQHVISLLKDSNIYCLPTVYPEGLPTSVLEAIVCKTYVITTVYGGTREIIVDDSYGCIMNGNEVEDLTNQIRKVIEEDEYREAAAEKCYGRFISKFTWENTFNELEKLL